MAILIDTNVLLRSVQPHHPLNSSALSALRFLAQGPETLGIIPQVIVEFWTVATRPVANNGLGLTPEATRVEIDRIMTTFELFPETAAVFDIWRDLVVQFSVSGLVTHDARIVAVMKSVGMKQILTFNDEDFRRFKEITVLKPQCVLPIVSHKADKG